MSLTRPAAGDESGGSRIRFGSITAVRSTEQSVCSMKSHCGGAEGIVSFYNR